VTIDQGLRTGWEQIDDDECRRAAGTVELIGRRWSSAIMLGIARGAARFSEILGSVSGLSDRMLALRLRELEHAGLIDRVVEPTTPVTVRYVLTAQGRDLLTALQPLVRYGQVWERAESEHD